MAWVLHHENACLTPNEARPATEPGESAEHQDCRRFLTPQESGVPGSALKRSKLGRFHVSVSRHAWKVDQIYFSMGGSPGDWVMDIEAGMCGASDTIRVPIEHAVVESE